MTDMRVKTPFGWKETKGTGEGVLITEQSYQTKIYSTTGAGAISKTTAINTDFPGKKTKLKKLEVTFSSAPTTSENFTVTRSSVGSDGGSRPLTTLFSTDPATLSATSILQIWEEGGVDLAPGDEVKMAYTNTDTRTIKAELTIEVVQ